jgi:hypothetical protein
VLGHLGRDGPLAEVSGEDALGNGEGGAEAFVNDAGCGRRLVSAREVTLQQFLLGDDVAELTVGLPPKVVHYLAGFFAEPVGVRLQLAALFKKGSVELSSKGANEAVGEEESRAVPDPFDIGHQLRHGGDWDRCLGVEAAELRGIDLQLLELGIVPAFVNPVQVLDFLFVAAELVAREGFPVHVF